MAEILFFRCFEHNHFNPRHVAAVETNRRKLDRFHSHLVLRVERGMDKGRGEKERERERQRERVEGKGLTEEHLNTLTVKFKLARVARAIIPSMLIRTNGNLEI